MNNINYIKIAKQLKVMAEPKRLKIINLLSNGKMCATDILKEFRVSQPTLSHDMKALVDGKFVIADRLGQKMFYSLNPDTIFDLQAALSEICNGNPSGTVGGHSKPQYNPVEITVCGNYGNGSPTTCTGEYTTQCTGSLSCLLSLR